MTDTIDREQVRVAIATRLKPVLEGQNLVQEVFDHIEADFGTKTPITMIATGGADTQPMTGMGLRAELLYDLHVYVLYASTDGTWTPAMSATRLDRIYNAIVTWLGDPANSGPWQTLRQAQPSLVATEAIGGLGYWHEMIPILAEVF